jgi:uncharacterized protein YqfA (UPF0365 family)
MDSNLLTVVLLCVLLLVVILLVVIILPDIWWRALVSGTYVGILELLRIRIKRLDARLIVMAYIKARKSGVALTIAQLETHAQARGNVDSVINACIAAVNGGMNLPVNVAMAIDLSGRDVKEAVRHTISPRVIETPAITAICKNGIELSVRAKVTLKANLERIIGGVNEETIIARVTEGIVTCIGNAHSHNELLEKADVITRQLTTKISTFNDMAFDVLSVDISKIEIGRNVGAELDIDLAESRKIVAQADAEQRRTDALAAEQEMRAITQEMRARVVAAEALLPQALADALERGNLTALEYYKLDNLLADSQMRKKLAGAEQTDMLPAPSKKKSKLG